MEKQLYLVKACENVYYEKYIEATSEDEAYSLMLETVTDDDIIDGKGFEIFDISEA